MEQQGAGDATYALLIGPYPTISRMPRRELPRNALELLHEPNGLGLGVLSRLSLSESEFRLTLDLNQVGIRLELLRLLKRIHSASVP